MKIILSALILGVLVNSSVVHASFVIDSFNDVDSSGDPSFQIVTADGSDSIATSSAMGGHRSIEIHKSGVLNASSVVVGGVTGVYTHNSDALTSANSKITWDADGAGLNGDFLVPDTATLSGSVCHECFVYKIVDVDFNNVDLTIDVFDGTTHNSVDLLAVGSGVHEVFFSDFVGLDFSSIHTVNLQVKGGIAGDLTLDYFAYTGGVANTTSPVPLPAAFWLFTSGFLGLFGFSQGRKTFTKG